MFSHKYIVKLSASLIFSISSFVSLMIMTRFVGEEYGLMMWGMSIVATVNAAFDVGLTLTNIKKIADQNELGKCVSAALAIRGVLTVVMVIVLLILLTVLSFTGEGLGNEMMLIILVFLVYFIIDGFRQIMTSTFIGRMEAGNEAAILISEYITRSALLILFALAGMSAVILSLGYLGGTIVAVSLGLILSRRLKIRLTRPKMAPEYVKFAIPLALPLSLIMVITFVDRAIIGAFWGPLEVGYYSAAYGLFFATVTVGTVLNTLLLSHMSKLHSEGKKGDVHNTLWTSQRYLATFLLPVTAFLFIFGDDTASILFGGGFTEAGPILSILSLAIYPMVLGNILSHILLSTNRNASYGRMMTVYAVSVIIMFLLFVPDELFGIRLLGLGAVGAALSLLIGSVSLFLAASFVLKRQEGLRNYPRLILYLIAALILTAVLYIVRESMDFPGVLWYVIIALLSLTMYICMMIAVKEFTKDDVRFMIDTINPKNLYDDIKDEMKDD